ncbi:MAG: hypothetical protein FWH01_12405 [Oscillospiraceae bacterium]|nr:hypothetical protein [Oscillospiraceae bacterium]
MQTSKEVMRAAIEFKTPDRLPVLFDSFGISDVRRIGWNQTGTGDHGKRVTYDEWNCGWQRTEMKNMGQITIHPISEWADLDSFSWPDPDNAAFYEGMEKKFEGTDGYYLSTGIFMLLFERLHGLRGFENTMADLYMERERLEMLADRIVEFDIRVIENISSRFSGLIDGFSFTDDWGTELALIISPKQWREFFKPRYKKIFDAAHKAGWHVMMHSCGKVNEILGELYEIGCNTVELQQPRVMGIEEVGRQYAGKLCFQSLCDIQHTLPMEGDDAIEEEAKLLLDCWGTDSGGFILADYGDGVAIGVPKEKKQVMYDAFMKYDRWRKR